MNNSIASVGWYRFAKYNGDNLGGDGAIIDIKIMTTFNRDNNSVHHVELICTYARSKFKLVGGYSNTLVISKIRHVYDSINKKSYIDIYYNSNYMNGIFAYVKAYNYAFSPVNFEPIKESVDGCTIVSSVELTENY